MKSIIYTLYNATRMFVAPLACTLNQFLNNPCKAALVPCLTLLPLLAANSQTPATGVKQGAGVMRDSYYVSSARITGGGLAATHDDPVKDTDFAGVLKIHTAELAEQGDSLSLKMELRVSRDAVNKRQSWAIVPQLVAKESDDSLTQITFPYALINGKIREKLCERMISYGNRELLDNLPVVRSIVTRLSIKGNDVVLRYSVQIPYEPWMDIADLKLHTILISPAGKRQLLSVQNAGKVKFAPRMPYEVQPKVNYTEPAPEQKQRKMQGQAYLDFQVGRTVIIPTFRRNPEELGKIANAVAGVRSNADVNITGLFIEGYASPEGSYALNDKLARGRSEALRDYMVREYAFSRDMFRVNYVAEDWDGLKTLVQEGSLSDAQKQTALAVIEGNDDPDRKEARLRAQTATWKVINAEMFPQLRRVEYQIDFSVKDYTLEESRSLAGRNPEMLSQQELFLLAMSYPDASKERYDTFELIARMFPNDPVAAMNTAALMLSRGELAGAKRMLDKAGDDIRAYNNLGVYWLMTGELDKAEQYLGKAVMLGIGEAAVNMEEMKKKESDNKKMKRYQR